MNETTITRRRAIGAGTLFPGAGLMVVTGTPTVVAARAPATDPADLAEEAWMFCVVVMAEYVDRGVEAAIDVFRACADHLGRVRAGFVAEHGPGSESAFERGMSRPSHSSPAHPHFW